MKVAKIKNIKARQILDCKARPMLEVDVYTDNGFVGRGAAPTGTSVGEYESFIIRDNDPNEYSGMSVHKAARIVEEIIAPKLIGKNVCDQKDIDETMLALDGTPNKTRLGGNSIYSVSVANLRAAAATKHMPVYEYLSGTPIKNIPLPTFNVINGGRYKHLTQAFNEFIIAPYRAKTVEEAVSIAVSVYQRLESVIMHYQKNGEPPRIGGSYGWAAPSNDPEEVLKLICQAVDECGFTDKVAYCIDCASSEMYDNATNTYELKGKRVYAEDIIEEVRYLCQKFNIIFVEDILDENDWDGFEAAHKLLTKTNIIGDDFIVTNVGRLKKAYERNCIDGFILKPNQVGTITEALCTHNYAIDHGLLSIPSGRSGGAVGDVIADISIGLQSKISKNGAPKSGERLDKINTLLRVSSEKQNAGICDLTSVIKF